MLQVKEYMKMSLGNVKMVDYENSPLMLYTWIDGYTYFIDKFPGIWGNIGKTVGRNIWMDRRNIYIILWIR